MPNHNQRTRRTLQHQMKGIKQRDREPLRLPRDTVKTHRSSTPSKLSSSGRIRRGRSTPRDSDVQPVARQISDETESMTSDDTRRNRSRQQQRRNIDDSYHSATSSRRSNSSRSISIFHRNRRDYSSKDAAHMKRQVCIKGRNFDKHGRCWLHQNVKLASKKLLGGYKIYMESCPLCLEDGVVDCQDDQHSVVSSVSRYTDYESSDGYISSHSHRSRASRHNSYAPSVCSKRSKQSRSKSICSDVRTKSRSSRRPRSSKGRSKKKANLHHHPHVQLAHLEFCPQCAEDSLLKCFSDNLSCRSGQSGRSCRSSDSRRSFIESMPYVDGEGEECLQAMLIYQLANHKGEDS